MGTQPRWLPPRLLEISPCCHPTPPQVMHLLANPPRERPAASGGEAMEEDGEEEGGQAPLERQVVAQVVDALFDRWAGAAAAMQGRREVGRCSGRAADEAQAVGRLRDTWPCVF